jgi:succinate dehydrogenase/fumarate reductase cytochrome b subunit (b558 family)
MEVSYYSSALSLPGTVAALAEARAGRRTYVLKRLHSLSGVLPVGVFLLEHLWTNSKALQGEGAFTGAVNDLQSLPYLPIIEVFGIFLPLAFHGVYGAYLAFIGRQNALAYKYPRNWLYLLQRVSGLLTLGFIVYHLGEFRVQKLLHGMSAEAFYPTLQAHMSSTYLGVPWVGMLYLVGLAASVFHFANGLSCFCLSWGITVTRAAQRRVALACWGVGAVLFVVGASTVIFFATGSRFYPRSDLVSPVNLHAMACPGARPSP